ncbi:arylsulfatase A [Rhodopirellula maiorica SM1]|uniref:Arylsulfatase A n=1 Tax=Rhodopirellula maiorica SM1 TaxID=1265738 RepID=M5S460_9BACT|nr:arylsulfatase A [Rhodopirellula maiorica SM1]
MATFAALTGQEVDKKQLADSVNVLPALVSDNAMPLRESLVLIPRKPSHVAVRKGKWMYIPAQGSGGFTGKPPAHGAGGPAAVSFVGSENSDIENGKIKKAAPRAQLYDLEADLSQTTNLYHQNPEVVQQMEALLRTYRPTEATSTGGEKRKRGQR